MKALVTGASGFVGSRLVRRLVAEQQQVSLLVRKDSNLAEISPVLDRVRVHIIDRSAESVNAAMEAERPDVVFHLATYFAYDPAPHEINALVDGNILMPLQLLDAAMRCNVRHFVNTGSVWQHFRDADYDPVCLHAATKQAFETLLTYYLNTEKIRCITLKLSDTYGPDDPRRKIFQLLKKHAASGEPLQMSPGEQVIDPIHIDDVTNAFVMAATRLTSGAMQSPHEQYAVCGSRHLPLRQLVEMYAKVTGLSFPVIWGARAYRPREVMSPWAKGGSLPGWAPKVPLEDGLRQMASAG